MIGALANRLTSTWVTAILRARGVQVDENVIFFGVPIVSRAPNSIIRIGTRVSLCSSSKWTALGVSRKCVLRTLATSAELIIGRDSGLSGVSIVAQQTVCIGAECLLGSGVIVADTDFHPISAEGRRFRHTGDAESAPVVIEDNVFIGANAIVLKGVTIGRNSVVGAGSVVTANIPPNSIAAGNPARMVRALP